MDNMQDNQSASRTGATGGTTLVERAMSFLRLNKPWRFLLVVVVVLSGVVLYTISYSHVGLPRYLAVSDTKNRKVVLLDLEGSVLIRNFTGRPVAYAGESGPGAETDGAPAIVLKGRGASGDGDLAPGTEVDLRVPLGGRLWRHLESVMKAAQATVDEVRFPWKPVRARQVDCGKLFSGDPQETMKARAMEDNVTLAPQPLPDSQVSLIASSCPTFLSQVGFITSSLTEEEKLFPIAYSILVFKDAEQVMNLLRTIYRPQNFYCVHVDSKSPEDFRQAVVAMAACLPNVFLSSRSVDVQWGQFTVLEPEVICMQDLWRHKGWKYFINLTGQEFPLKTNWELVQILTAFNATNSLEGTRARANWDRWQQAGPLPGGIQPTKGSVHVTVSRDYVDFVLHSGVAQQFFNWTRRVGVPDEVFFSSLNHNPHLGIPGTYKGEPETHPTNYPFITRFKNWGSYPFDYPCGSEKRVRLICILATGDLRLLASRPELFANKFYWDFSRTALDCLAERLYNRTRDEYLGKTTFDVSYYSSLSFVKDKVINPDFVRTS